MTKRFGYWIVGTALGITPLAGCAQWGRTTTSVANDGEGCRPTHGQTTSAVPQFREPANQPSAPEASSAQDGKTAGLPPPELPPLSQDFDGRASRPEPPPKEGVPAPLAPTAGDLPKPVAVPPASLPPPRIEFQAKPDPPMTLEVDSDRRVPMVEALRCVIKNRHSEALQWLGKYNPSTQEICLRLFPVLANLTQKSIDELSPAEVDVVNEVLQIVADLVRPLSKLTIDKACFCEDIAAYGLFKPLPDGYAFRGSTSNRPGDYVQLYVELRNFASVLKNDVYVTRLSSKVEIRDQEGKQAWFYRFKDELPVLSRTLRHDHCNKYSFYVPELPAGSYTLIIHVTDQTRPDQPREASKSLPFRVTSMSARVP